jgi:NADH dehydrogenase
VFVGDVADAIVAALERPDAAGRAYELGGPRVATFAELLRWLLGLLGRRRLLLPLPFEVAALQARAFELLPAPPLTRDQVELLRSDNVVAEGALTLADLGITATPMEAVVPDYVRAFASWRARSRPL